jgi:hypothetical protein
MEVQVSMPANNWQTEVLTGPMLPAPIAIAPDQYITLRVAGDPAFTNASYQQLFVYAFDGAGNFGRWGSPVPTSTTNWQVFNFLASTIAQPWNSPALPNMTNIVQFDFYIYGQGDPPGVAYNATIYLSDLQIRDTPLIEFPPPAPLRQLIDDFEEYADDAALLSFYTYVDSPAATVTTASLATPAPQGPQGTNCLQLDIDFAPGQYPWGSVLSAVVPAFSLPTNAVVSLWFKGDPTLAPVADDGTTFWLSFYDEAGGAINFSTPAAPVISSEWTNLTAPYDQFWSTSTVDTGNLVQWRILVEGWMGTTNSPALSGTFYVDDIWITIPPVLAVVVEQGALSLQMDSLIPGTTYTLRISPDLSQWTTTTIQASSTSATWPIPAGQQKSFFQLFYTP